MFNLSFLLALTDTFNGFTTYGRSETSTTKLLLSKSLIFSSANSDLSRADLLSFIKAGVEFCTNGITKPHFTVLKTNFDRFNTLF